MEFFFTKNVDGSINVVQKIDRYMIGLGKTPTVHLALSNVAHKFKPYDIVDLSEIPEVMVWRDAAYEYTCFFNNIKTWVLPKSSRGREVGNLFTNN